MMTHTLPNSLSPTGVTSMKWCLEEASRDVLTSSNLGRIKALLGHNPPPNVSSHVYSVLKIKQTK